MNQFEDHLWSHLSDEHGADEVACSPSRARRRPRPAVVTAGVGGITAAAVAATLVLSATTSTTPAYALTENANGTVTITLNDVATGIPALNAEFKRLGIRERAVPMEANCPTRPIFGYDGSGTAPGLNGLETTYTFSVAHPDLLPGYTGYLAARQVAPGQVELSEGAMPNGTIPSCFSDQVLHLVSPPPGSPAGTPYTTATGVTPTTPDSTATGSTSTDPGVASP
jgi:hypothetical protein